MPVLYLHPSPDATLLPLLSSHLPNSITALGPLELPRAGTQRRPIAWASFAPSSVDRPPPLWLVLVLVQPPATTNELRLYCSHERELASSNTDDDGPAAAEAEALVRACVKEAKALWEALKAEGGVGETLLIGGTNARWETCLDEKFYRSPGVEGPDCQVWVAPLPPVEVQKTSNGQAPPGLAGLEFRLGTEDDVDQMMSVTVNNRRTREYVLSLLPHSTVATLPNPTTPGARTNVAWILTHPDGALGFLYTSPDLRKRGLGRQVVQHRLASVGADRRSFAFVATGNEASEALWKSLGWERWGVGWASV